VPRRETATLKLIRGSVTPRDSTASNDQVWAMSMAGRARGAGQGQRRSGGRAWREACGPRIRPPPTPPPRASSLKGAWGAPGRPAQLFQVPLPDSVPGLSVLVAWPTITIPDVGIFQIPIVRRRPPRRDGHAMLYGCPGSEPRRHLYLRSFVVGRLVDYKGPRCQACAGLRWASQGRSRGSSIVRFGLGWGRRPPIGFFFRVIPGILGRPLIPG
jgi:hypothetical protein